MTECTCCKNCISHCAHWDGKILAIGTFQAPEYLVSMAREETIHPCPCGVGDTYWVDTSLPLSYHDSEEAALQAFREAEAHLLEREPSYS